MRDKWKLIHTVYPEKETAHIDNRKLLCSFDSGDKTPQTIYSFDDGDIIEVSSRLETQQYLSKLLHNQDELKKKSKELRRVNRMISKCQSKVSKE